MNQHLFAAALCAALLVPAAARAADETAPAAPPAAEAKPEVKWIDDFDKAVELAKKEKKDIFVDFTGSDWCSWCIRLRKEVFVHEAFFAEAGKQYVLVELDFPRSEELKAKVPNPARNQELFKKYGLPGYPSILLFTADGDAYAQMGYQPGGPEKYVERMAILREGNLPELAAAKELTRLVKESKGPERVAAAEKAIASLRELTDISDQLIVRVEPVKAVVAADPENKEGLAAKALAALFRVGKGDEAALASAAKLDPKNELGLLEHAVKAKAATLGSLEDVHAFVKSADELVAMGELKDKDLARDLFVNVAFMNYEHLRDAEKALAYAKRALAIGFGPAEEQVKKFVEKVIADEGKKPEQAQK
jgi:thioredoxin-related protein